MRPTATLFGYHDPLSLQSSRRPQSCPPLARTLRRFSNLSEVQIQIWKLIFGNYFEKASFHDVARFNYHKHSYWGAFLVSPQSKTTLEMNYPLGWRGFSWWKQKDIEEYKSQKFVLHVVHTSHLLRHVVLNKWLRSVEKMPSQEKW